MNENAIKQVDGFDYDLKTAASSRREIEEATA